MHVGRWSSDAFLEYIGEQGENFTVDVSENMIKFETFFNMSNDQTRGESSNNNENGPDRVPFQVNYSQLSLTVDSHGVSTKNTHFCCQITIKKIQKNSFNKSTSSTV